MNMQRFLSIAGLLVVAVSVIVVLGFFKGSEPGSSVSNQDDAAVRQVVTDFGTKLQMVSLLAPEAQRKAAMDANYSAYVAPELLAQWYPEGAEGALGRQTSSPWPERIEIVEVRASGNDYVVEGNVIEVTSEMAGAQKEAAAVYPVTLTLQGRNGTWMIVKAVKGSYSTLPQRQTLVGYWECLPHKDKSGPQTTECAFGIALDASDAHYAVSTSLMSTYPVDFPTGTKVRISGVVTPVEMLNSIQKYDIDGIISATSIERL
jgi:hypothetical protein